MGGEGTNELFVPDARTKDIALYNCSSGLAEERGTSAGKDGLGFVTVGPQSGIRGRDTALLNNR
jgi:hypothetical protein